MKTIFLTMIICFVCITESSAQNISKLFGKDISKDRYLNFERTIDSSEIFVSYDAKKSKTEQNYFHLISEAKEISCDVYDDGTIKSAYFHFVEKGKGIDPDIVISIEIAKNDRFISYYIKPIVDEFLKNLSTYDKIKEYGQY